MVDGLKTPGLRQPKPQEGCVFVAPEGFWIRCDDCGAILQKAHVNANLEVCSECNFHFRISAWQRLKTFCDKDSFVECDADLEPGDPLEFFDSKTYPDRVKIAQKKTQMKEGFVSGSGLLASRAVEVGSFEFGFMGGSMGTVVGEKVSRLFDRACQNKNPAIIFQASGGARMQEGILSLMQMAKTTVARSRLEAAGIPYISVMTDPTTGGVAASFAMLGDFNIAEPKALIGFAGPRVIQQTINQKLPTNFQRAEFLLEHGMIDAIVHRRDLPHYISKILKILGPHKIVK